MTKFFLVTLITFFTAQVFADPTTKPEKQICDSIKEKVVAQEPPYQICGDIIRNFEQYDAQIFTGICNEVMMKMSSSVDDETVRYCNDQFKPVTMTTVSEGDAMMRVPVDSTAPIPTEPVTIASVAMDKCQEDDLSNFACPIKTSFVLPDLNSIVRSISPIAPLSVSRRTPAVYTFEKCNCFEMSVKKTFSLEKRVKFEFELAEEKKRVNDLIFNAAGKKIINAFAANLEDINFYKTNNVQAIGGDQFADELQCTNSADFKKVIMEECNKNQISAADIKSRSDALLGAFGDFKNQTSIEGKFKELQEQVLNAQLDPSKIVPGGPKSYSRHDYDKSRFGISQKRDEVKFMSELTVAVMDDPELNKLIGEHLVAGKKPGHAIIKIVSDESNERVKKVLRLIVKKHKEEGFYKNLGVALDTENQEDLHGFMMNTYDLATDMHPGLKAIFRSPALFGKTHEQMKKNGNGHDLIAELDRDPELLKTFFQKRCEGIKAQFSEAICYKPENLMDLANKEDLNKLLSSVSGQVNPIMKDAILCRMTGDNQDPNSIFSKLSFNMGDKLAMADYFKRKVNVNGGPASRFEKFAMEFSGGGSNSKYLSEMSDFKSELRKPSAEFAAINNSSSEKRIENISQSTQASQPEKATEQVQLNPSFNNYAASSMPVAMPEKEHSQTARDHRDNKTLLREFLADEENKEEVDRHLTNLSSKEQAELARLKDEIAADKEKILALLQESERLKLKGLEQKVNEAEANLTQPKVQTTKAVNNRKNTNYEEFASSSGNIAAVSSSGSSAKENSSSSDSSSSSSSTSSGSNGRGSSGAQRSLASLNSSLSTAVNNVAPVSATGPGTSVKAEIIIQSSGSEDISKEVISYVQKTEPDVETLKQLKTKGMTFKYKVMENGVAVDKELKVKYASLSKEAKKFLDQKIAIKEAKRNYSYSALRLMLGLKAQEQL